MLLLKHKTIYSMELLNVCNASSQRGNLTFYDETNKKCHEQLSQGEPSRRQAPGANPSMKGLGQGRLAHHSANGEETMDINNDWVYNEAYRLSHVIHFISHCLICLIIILIAH